MVTNYARESVCTSQGSKETMQCHAHVLDVTSTSCQRKPASQPDALQKRKRKKENVVRQEERNGNKNIELAKENTEHRA